MSGRPSSLQPLEALAACALAAAGCGHGHRAQDTALHVWAAASTQDVLLALAPDLEPARRVELRFSFGASGALARQIADGAPADVFVTADPRWLEELARDDLLRGAPVVFAGNRLVCATRPGAGWTEGVDGVEQLLRALPQSARVAVGSRGVPAGDYARSALAATGGAAALADQLVGQPDARAVVTAVAGGHAAAGFVYATDARSARLDVLFELPVPGAAPIRYAAAVLRQARDLTEARSFVEALTSSSAQRVLREHGFSLP